jgi:hypothetical protein
MFDYLHEPAVNEVILSFVTSPAEFKSSRIDELITSIHTSGIWYRLVQRIVSTREPEMTSGHAVTLIEGMIKRAQHNRGLATLLINDIDRAATATDTTSSKPPLDLLSQLLSVVSSTAITRVWQLHQCTRLLTALLASWYTISFNTRIV